MENYYFCIVFILKFIKHTDMELASKYEPQAVEARWYKYWMDNKMFSSKPDGREPYTIVIPPPNVTGVLHMGHMLNNTIQDILVRRARMEGKNACWVPGTDHASIATEAKVVNKLAEQGLKKSDLTRDEFLKHAWDWTNEHGGIILKQLRKLGASCDWDRTAFTMDDKRSEGVIKVFCDLYNKGLIYRGVRMVNWDPKAQTALSDEEVIYKDEHSKLYYLRYMVVEEPGRYAIVATTRPETIMGDTAMCINPDDPKNQWLKGKHVIVPLVGREIPVIEDEYVDINFGTGCLKVTPAHDINDHALGLKHHLDTIDIFNDNGTISEAAGLYVGMDRMDVRKQIAKDLTEAGLMEKVEDYNNKVGFSERTNVPIEPKLSTQWFLSMKHFADLSLEPVMSDEIQFYPPKYKNIYRHWLENIKDWCISRQLWWGHRIPVWYCDDCGEMSASRTDLEKCPKCGSTHIHQDEDALDTWFSSALWPFSTMGWPDNTELLKQFYPTSVLVTGYDIIFFWVARMLIMGMEFMKEIPFEKVFIHGLVRDSQGGKMSKSLGNGIDPLEVIEKYGADTLRFMLITGNTPGNDMRFYWERVEGTRNFANKIWNASRFALMNMEGYDKDAELAPYTLADKWILSRLQDTVKDVTGLLERFELGEAGRAIYDFIWSEVCDWYIEIAKPRLYNKEAAAERATAQHVLATVLVSAMKLLHPYMPFITEEIYQCLPHEAESIMISKWPVADESLVDPEAERGMNAIMDSIKAIRNMRAEVNANPGKKIPAIMLVSEDLREVVAHNDSYIKLLGGIDNLELRPLNGEKPENAMAAVVTGIEVYLPLAGLIDVEKETQRLSKELAAMEKDLQRAGGKLNNAGFLAKAPEDVIAKERAKYEELSGKIEAVKKRMAYLAELK